MNNNQRRAALARLSCICAFVVSLIIVVGIAGYIELLRSTTGDLVFVGDGGLFSEAIWIPILFLVGSLLVPFGGLAAGLHALNNLEAEKQDRRLIGALAGNLLIFLPVFLMLAYFFILFLNEI